MDDQDIKLKMQQWGIREQDIQETFILSSGPGGQNVNKTSTCVSLLHAPTGIRVKCQSERSQNLNRKKARSLLIAAIEQKALKAQQQIHAHKEKLKRQNRRRSKAAKERILEKKRFHSEKKASRKKLAW